MRRITLWLMSTIAAVVLLFSYRTSTMGADSASTTATGAGGTGSTGGTAGGTTYQGSVASTRWGDVQVTITVADGKITSVAVPTYPSGNGRDREINARALPILTQETIAAQSADIDSVSGATVTSDGYKESLQAALDAAHLSS
jgi:uncharacterized protein with FMN-binding domain